MSQTFFPKFPLFAKIRFNPFDSVPLATMHFAMLRHHKRHYFAKFLVDQEPRLPTGSSEWPITKPEKLATTTGTCRPRLPVLIYSTPFVMSQNWEMQGCQWILYISPKNIFQKEHFPEKHLAEWAFPRMYIFQNGHLPECTFVRMDISSKIHFPKWPLAKMYNWC